MRNREQHRTNARLDELEKVVPRYRGELATQESVDKLKVLIDAISQHLGISIYPAYGGSPAAIIQPLPDLKKKPDTDAE